MVLAVPPEMGQVLPLMQRLSLQPSGAFPEGEPMLLAPPKHAGSLEALWVHGQRPWLHVELTAFERARAIQERLARDNPT